MKKEIEFSGRFKKDLKRYRHKPQQLNALEVILNYLSEGQPIPASYEPHYLQGQYEGCMECHVQNDFLLIWFDTDHDIIKLLRLGTHSELFGR